MAACERQCPFCFRWFKALGMHLHSCTERGDTDYAYLLSAKTLAKKAKKSSAKQFCSSCHRWFLRLDAHRLRSSTCRSVISEPVAEADEVQDALATLSPRAPPTPHNCSPPSSVNSAPNRKLPLVLPSSSGDWEKVDQFLCTTVVQLLPPVKRRITVCSLVCTLVCTRVLLLCLGSSLLLARLRGRPNPLLSMIVP